MATQKPPPARRLAAAVRVIGVLSPLQWYYSSGRLLAADAAAEARAARDDAKPPLALAVARRCSSALAART